MCLAMLPKPKAISVQQPGKPGTPIAVAVKHVAPKFAVSGLVSSARNGTVSPSSLRGTGSIRAVVPRIRYVWQNRLQNIAAAAQARLQPLRAKVARAQRERILNQVWDEIRTKQHALATKQPIEETSRPPANSNNTRSEPGQSARNATVTSSPPSSSQPNNRADLPSRATHSALNATVTSSPPSSSQPNNRADLPSRATHSPVYNYVCPFCQKPSQSRVYTGTVDHRNHCGKQFRVTNGVVSRAAEHQHQCPKCGVFVTSSKSFGRIRVRHKNAAGRTCTQQSWTVG